MPVVVRPASDSVGAGFLIPAGANLPQPVLIFQGELKALHRFLIEIFGGRNRDDDGAGKVFDALEKERHVDQRIGGFGSIGAISEKCAGVFEEENGAAFLGGVEKREQTFFRLAQVTADNLSEADRLKRFAAAPGDRLRLGKRVFLAARANQDA